MINKKRFKAKTLVTAKDTSRDKEKKFVGYIVYQCLEDVTFASGNMFILILNDNL